MIFLRIEINLSKGILIHNSFLQQCRFLLEGDDSCRTIPDRPNHGFLSQDKVERNILPQFSALDLGSDA
jgi:hypothetical protein